MPQTNSSNRSATRGSDGSRRARAACAAGQCVRKVGCAPTDARLDPFKEKPEEQVLPGFPRAQPRPGGGRERWRIAGRGQHIGARIAGERFGDGDALDAGKVRGHATARHDRRQDGAQIGRGLLDQRVHPGARPIPFQHGELSRVQVAALAVSPYPGDLENRPRSRHQQLLHGELGAGVQPERFAATVRMFAVGAKGGQMHFLAGGRHRAGRFDLDITARREEGTGRLGKQGTAAQERQARGEAIGMPDRAGHRGDVIPILQKELIGR